jgi:tRNA A-37 threonylcarbamoyl transferase component Bud32
MLKARKAGIDTPGLYLLDIPKGLIYMEFIDGHTVKTTLRTAHPVTNPIDTGKLFGPHGAQ